MSKIVQVMNIMITFKEKISNVRKSCYPNEYYFIYDSKYVWSIHKDNDDNFSITNYPLAQNYETEGYINYLANSDAGSDNVDSVSYSTRELKTREARESFSELYTTVKEKLLGIDTILDDIIKHSEDIPF
jgi:hypothetical protein